MFFSGKKNSTEILCEVDGKPPRGASPARKRGFTLLELILVCVIIIIIMGAVSASMSGFLARSRLRASAARLASMAVFARTRSITMGRQVVLRVSQPANEIALLEESTDTGGAFTSIDNRWRLRLPETLSIANLEIEGEILEEGDIVFFPEGGASEAHLVLALHPAAGKPAAMEEKQIWVNRVTGRVKVE
jgi:type II secretory pathway pseudopilin PulG